MIGITNQNAAQGGRRGEKMDKNMRYLLGVLGLEKESDASRWMKSYNHALQAVPCELCKTESGSERVTEYLRDMIYANGS